MHSFNQVTECPWSIRDYSGGGEKVTKLFNLYPPGADVINVFELRSQGTRILSVCFTSVKWPGEKCTGKWKPNIISEGLCGRMTNGPPKMSMS